jgi:Uri superfamily endonuclease
MKGAYTLIIHVEQPVKVEIKSLGEVRFESGLWIYVGSAMGESSTSLEHRIRRHFRIEKTIYWHIDYLLDADTELLEAIWAESMKPVECDIAHSLENHEKYSPGPRGFGSSDCRKNCVAHIFHYNGDTPIQESIIQVFRNSGLQPFTTKDGLL